MKKINAIDAPGRPVHENVKIFRIILSDTTDDLNPIEAYN